jgi:hypothetical protein
MPLSNIARNAVTTVKQTQYWQHPQLRHNAKRKQNAVHDGCGDSDFRNAACRALVNFTSLCKQRCSGHKREAEAAQRQGYFEKAVHLHAVYV